MANGSFRPNLNKVSTRYHESNVTLTRVDSGEERPGKIRRPREREEQRSPPPGRPESVPGEIMGIHGD